MGMTEKESLINTITVMVASEYGANIKEVKAKVSEILQSYHVTISDESDAGKCLETNYLMKKFSDAKSSIGMLDATIKQYRIAVDILEKKTGKRLADVEVDDITKFFKVYGSEVSNVTLRAKYQLLSSVYNFLFNHRYIVFNPIAYIESPKATVIYKTPLTDFDLEKIKRACEMLEGKEGVRDMALIHFFISTGCRVSELCKIKIGDIDFDRKQCVVMGKGKKQRPVVLTDKALYRIKLYLNTRKDLSLDAPLFAHIRGEEKPMTKDGVGRVIQKLKELADIDKVTCHTFRRYYATELRKRGVNIQMIANSLGHANLNQINRYSLYSNGEMIDIIQRSM